MAAGGENADGPLEDPATGRPRGILAQRRGHAKPRRKARAGLDGWRFLEWRAGGTDDDGAGHPSAAVICPVRATPPLQGASNMRGLYLC